MKKIDVKKSVVVNVNLDQAWKIIALDFVHISKYTTGVLSSYENPDVTKDFDAAPVGGRVCAVKNFGKMHENILHFDENNHKIAWNARGDKLPGFIKGLKNTMTMDQLDDNSTRVSSNITVEVSGVLGFIMAPLMRRNFSKVISEYFEDFIIYAETGEPSVTKKQELASV